MSSIPNPNTPNGSGAGTVRRAMQVLLGLTVIVLLVGGAALFLLNGQVRTVQAAVDAKEAQVGTSSRLPGAARKPRLPITLRWPARNS